jgi:hypothetical protein
MTSVDYYRDYGGLRSNCNEAAADFETTDAVNSRKSSFSAPANPVTVLHGGDHAIDEEVRDTSVAPRYHLDTYLLTCPSGKRYVTVEIGTGQQVYMGPDCNKVSRNIRKGCFVVAKGLGGDI